MSLSLPTIPVRTILRHNYVERARLGEHLVHYDHEDGKTYVLDLCGFVHPGPLLIGANGKVKPGMNITNLFHAQSFHKGKDPTAHIKVVGILVDEDDAITQSEQGKEERVEPEQMEPDPIDAEQKKENKDDLDEMCSLVERMTVSFRATAEIVLAFTMANRPPGAVRKLSMSDQRQVQADAARFLPILQEMQCLIQDDKDVPLDEFLVKYRLPYWEFAILQDLHEYAQRIVSGSAS